MELRFLFDELEELGEAWIVVLSTVETNTWGMWELRIASRRNGEIRAFRGTLRNVIERASSGEKGDL